MSGMLMLLVPTTSSCTEIKFASDAAHKFPSVLTQKELMAVEEFHLLMFTTKCTACPKQWPSAAFPWHAACFLDGAVHILGMNCQSTYQRRRSSAHECRSYLARNTHIDMNSHCPASWKPSRQYCHCVTMNPSCRVFLTQIDPRGTSWINPPR